MKKAELSVKVGTKPELSIEGESTTYVVCFHLAHGHNVRPSAWTEVKQVEAI